MSNTEIIKDGQIIPDYYKDEENKGIVEPSTPQASKAQQHAQKLELAVLLEFMRGKRLKQLCKPFNLSAKAVEDTLRRGLGRRMVQGNSAEPPEGTRRMVTTKKPDKPGLPKGEGDILTVGETGELVRASEVFKAPLVIAGGNK